MPLFAAASPSRGRAAIPRLRLALNVAQENDTVLLIAGDRKRYLVRLRAGDRIALPASVHVPHGAATPFGAAVSEAI